eukprot:6176573-Pleurochrysis_carterae.AAC.2
MVPLCKCAGNTASSSLSAKCAASADTSPATEQSNVRSALLLLGRSGLVRSASSTHTAPAAPPRSPAHSGRCPAALRPGPPLVSAGERRDPIQAPAPFRTIRASLLIAADERAELRLQASSREKLEKLRHSYQKQNHLLFKNITNLIAAAAMLELSFTRRIQRGAIGSSPSAPAAAPTRHTALLPLPRLPPFTDHDALLYSGYAGGAGLCERIEPCGLGTREERDRSCANVTAVAGCAC